MFAIIDHFICWFISHSSLFYLRMADNVPLMSSSGKSLIESYEQQFAALTAELTGKISRATTLPSSMPEEERTTLLRQIDKLFADCDELLEQIELEIRDFPAGVRPKYEAHLKGYRAELERLKRDLRSRRAALIHALEKQRRAQLLGHKDPSRFEDVDLDVSPDSSLSSARSPLVPLSDGQRSTLLNSHSALNRTSEQLDQALSVAGDTERVGVGILDDLAVQRETIERSRARLHALDDTLARSGRLLNTMLFRVRQHRLLLALVLVALFLAIIGVLAFKFRHLFTS